MKEEVYENPDWLPVVELDGIEYVVDVGCRQFRPICHPADGIGFRSDKGQKMLKAMIGIQWRAFVPREIWVQMCAGEEMVV